MRTVKFSAVFLVCAYLVLASGCGSELEDCRLHNRTHQQTISELEAKVKTIELDLDQCNRKVVTADDTCNIEKDMLQQQIAALEEDLTRKKSLITRMQEQLLGAVPLPPELSTMLEDFAKENEMVTYDASRGVVKFKSDLLFELGSDKVEPAAAGAVKGLCKILNSEQGKKFDIIIAGHTDDINRFRPATQAKHPTNWHLSAHRAISVQKVMLKNNTAPERTSIRGFGEYRPIAPNKPGRKGNPKNRRVEIYIVPRGT